jgi:hypothetical protein
MILEELHDQVLDIVYKLFPGKRCKINLNYSKDIIFPTWSFSAYLTIELFV